MRSVSSLIGAGLICTMAGCVSPTGGTGGLTGTGSTGGVIVADDAATTAGAAATGDAVATAAGATTPAATTTTQSTGGFGGFGGFGDTGIGIFGIPPAQTSMQDIANYEAAVASIGCNLITDADYQPVEIQTGMSRERILNISQFEIDAGKAAPIQGGGTQLQTGACSPTNA